MYADYVFYANSYYGDLISEEEYQKYGSRASDFLDWATRNHLVDNLPSDEDSLLKVRKACCAVADQLKQIDTIRRSEQNAGEAIGVAGINGQLKSISSGGESFSFETSAVGKAVSQGQEATNRYLFEAVRPYLSGVSDDTGRLYLYWGI